MHGVPAGRRADFSRMPNSACWKLACAAIPSSRKSLPGARITSRGGDQDFHFAIARASHNQRLFRSLSDNIYDVMRPYRFRSSQTPGRAVEALKEHRAIVDALRARDPAKAEAAMRAHIRSSWLNTETAFQKTERN